MKQLLLSNNELPSWLKIFGEQSFDAHNVRPNQTRLLMKKISVRSHALGMKLLFLALLMTCGFGLGKSADCQTLYGSITGTVSDPTGAAVPGATVTATQTETNVSRTETSNGSGSYTLSSLAPGTYRIVITKSGFEGYQAQNMDVKLNEVTRADVTLTIGTAKETVTVSAESAQLQTDRTDVTSEVTSTDLQNLPQPTRTYEGMLGSVAGVGTPSAAGLGTNNPDRSMTIEANGTTTSATDVRVEGVPAPDPWVPFYSTLVPSVEAIETVSMVTGSAEADQTLSSGATINIQLKSGTNHFHGEAYWFHIDNSLTAQPYFAPPGTPLSPNLDNNAGGTVGGPIIRNRLFFFASYEGDFDHTSYINTATVPTAAMLAGDFTATNTLIYDPNTGNPDGTGKTSFLAETGKNAIPVNRINSNIAPLLALISHLTPTNSATSNNFIGVVNTPETLHKIDTKVDWNATNKLRVTGRLNIHPYKVNQLANFAGGQDADSALNVGNTYQNGNTYGTTIAATYVATPHFVIDGSWGFTRSIQNIVPFYDNVKYCASTLGISGTNLSPLPVGGGMCQFNFNGYSGYGYGYPDLKYNDPQFSYTGNASWAKGNHTIKFGTNINQQHMNHNENSTDALNFNGNATVLNGGPLANQYNSYAAFLLGLPDHWQNSFQPFTISRLRSWQYSFYVKDTWQVNKKLTANFGTGWAYLPIATHGSYGLENYIQSTNVYEVCGYGGIPKNCGINVGKGLWSPSLGLAYRIFSSWVIRSGFSIAAEQFNISRDLIYNYPEDIGYSANALNPYVAVGSLSTGIPTIPVPDYQAGIIPLPSGASFYTLPHNIVHGYVESYNLTVQKQIRTWLAQVGFVGNSAIHQHQRYDINYGTVGGGVPSQQLYAALGTSAQEIGILPYGHTHYDALQATLERRFANGFQLRSTYTYSKVIGLCCDSNGFGQLGTPIPQYQRLNYVVLSFDQRHVFNLSGIAQSPFGKGKQFLHNGVGAAVLGNWQLGAVLTMYSGSPFSVGADGSSLNAPGSSQRADQVKSYVAINGGTQEYFDITAFQPVTAVRFGTAPYNSLVGPGAINLDSSVFRTFQLPGHLATQFRIESFNTTNTPHFGDPGSTVSSVQYDASGNIVNPNGFGQITGTNPGGRYVDERYFRVGLKITF